MKTVVDINGRKYDARTGALLTKNIVSLTAQKNTHVIKRGTFIDGVNRRKPKRNKANFPPLIRAEKAKTLLRSAVKKPVGALSLGGQVTDNQSLKNNLFKRVSNERAERAASSLKSEQIKRFTAPKQPAVKITDLPLAQEPKQRIIFPSPPAISKIFKKPKYDKPEVFEHHIVSSTNHLNKPLPREKFYVRLARHIHVKPKYMAVGIAVFAVLVFGSYVAYLRVPSLAMRVAANQAGFMGHLPSNIPAGYIFKGPIKTDKSIIILNYASNSDQRFFSIIQKPTNWSSEALLSNFLISSKLQYQTYHDKGLTVYIYNDGDATWVDKGIWYSLNDRGALSSDQILAIAGSM